MSTRLFGRQVILQLGRANQPGKDFRGFRVRFQVTATQDTEPNEAKISIWNTNANTHAMVTQEDAVLRLLVGYQTPLLLFQGRPIEDGVSIKREATDRVLSIEAQDGGAEMSSNLNLSWSTDTTLHQVVAALQAQSGLELGTLDLPDRRFVGGLSLQGSASRILRRLSAMSGRRFFVRDGALVAVSPGSSTGERSVVFSAAAGNLIGSPTAKDDGVQVRALLGGAEGLRPGKPFRLESEQFTGDYVAEDVKFSGDSGFSNDFYVTVTGTPL